MTMRLGGMAARNRPIGRNAAINRDLNLVKGIDWLPRGKAGEEKQEGSLRKVRPIIVCSLSGVKHGVKSKKTIPVVQMNFKTTMIMIWKKRKDYVTQGYVCYG